MIKTNTLIITYPPRIFRVFEFILLITGLLLVALASYIQIAYVFIPSATLVPENQLYQGIGYIGFVVEVFLGGINVLPFVLNKLTRKRYPIIIIVVLAIDLFITYNLISIYLNYAASVKLK